MKPPPIPILILCLPMLVAIPRSAPGAVDDDYPEQAEMFRGSCVDCHTIGEGVLIGPDLLSVNSRRDRSWLMSYIEDAPAFQQKNRLARELFDQYEEVVMPPAELSTPEIEGLLEYIAAFDTEFNPGVLAPTRAEATPGLGETVALPDEPSGVAAPGAALSLIALVAAVGLWRARQTGTAKVTAVIALGIGYWSFGGQYYHHSTGNDQGYEPKQPIEFSHALHSGELEVSCISCHDSAAKGPTAGVPTIASCMTCHDVVRKRSDQVEPSAEIAKLVGIWETRNSEAPETIPWERVHKLPDFVRFDHQVHVKNRIQCQECHGRVEEMTRVRQVASLSMQWCLDCHRIEKPKAPLYWRRVGGSQDCIVCHI